ncbi:MAG: helix-turn-helix domain-containing protein [Candidatus Humimicrobiaceae bacterium]
MGYYFEHIFRKETGFTFNKYLNNYRVIEAKKNLMKADICRVCYDSGFNSLSHFYKIFKRYTGKSPKSYKHELQYDNNIFLKN